MHLLSFSILQAAAKTQTILCLILYQYIFHPNSIKNTRAKDLLHNVKNGTQLNDSRF